MVVQLLSRGISLSLKFKREEETEIDRKLKCISKGGQVLIESFCEGTGMGGSSVLAAHFVCFYSILMKFFHISNFSCSLSWLLF